MGRKPNPLIQEYFDRGSKLADSSNRYPHTCKLCGERFPKGRLDSLMSHITKKCPAISEAARMHACLTFNGLATSRPHQDQSNDLAQTQRSLNQQGYLFAHLNVEQHPQNLSSTPAETPQCHGDPVQQHSSILSQPQAPRTPEPLAHTSLERFSQASPQAWSALEALAEVSRQVDMNEKQESRAIENDANTLTNGSIRHTFETHVESPLPHTLGDTGSSAQTPLGRENTGWLFTSSIQFGCIC